MFSSLMDAARNSPFKGPLTVANCDAVAAAAVVPASGDSCEFGSTKYFLLCGLGGIISCGKWFFFHVLLIKVQSIICYIICVKGEKSRFGRRKNSF